MAEFILGASIPWGIKRWLDEEAEKRGMSRSALVRHIIIQHITDHTTKVEK